MADRRLTPYGDSYTPGCCTLPERQNNLVPVDCGVPTAANVAAAARTIWGTFASVSTLLTTVGLPKRPTCTGNGGLLRGSPRLPSIDSKIAVSSPQMYRPPPPRPLVSGV